MYIYYTQLAEFPTHLFQFWQFFSHSSNMLTRKSQLLFICLLKYKFVTAGKIRDQFYLAFQAYYMLTVSVFVDRFLLLLKIYYSVICKYSLLCQVKDETVLSFVFLWTRWHTACIFRVKLTTVLMSLLPSLRRATLVTFGTLNYL